MPADGSGAAAAGTAGTLTGDDPVLSGAAAGFAPGIVPPFDATSATAAAN